MSEPEPLPENLPPLPEGIDEEDVQGIIYDGDEPVGIWLGTDTDEEE